MKTQITNYYFTLIMVFFAFNFMSAQTAEQRKQISATYDQAKLTQLAKTYAKTYETDLKAAEDYAKANNLPLTFEVENGGVAKLQKVLEDGTLIYMQTNNRGAGFTVRANKVYTGPAGGLNLKVEGQGMTIGVWDGGKVRATHELLGTDRIVQMDNATVLSDHATHVSGTLIGSSTPQSGAARGMAFKGSLQANDFDNDLSEMTTQSAAGLLISSHSYGYNAENLPQYYFGRYDNKAAAEDNLLYNAPYYTVVVSAGNDRNAGYNAGDGGYDLLTDQGVAKNNITVAAVNELLNYTGAASVVMSDFSSWGPTDDGRIKPDLSAKGVHTFSSVASSDTSYSYYNGTSMATPSVAGALTLLQQLHSDLHGNFMKSATLKALAIHTVNEAGPNPGPDYQFGWGLLNIEGGAKTLLKQGFQSVIEENNLLTGHSYSKSVTALGTEPLVVTIAWTDPAGAVQGTTEDDLTSRLVNDLDLRLIDAGGTITYPWRLSPLSFSGPAEKGVNSIDNVEKVEITAPAGNYTIIVTHKGTLVNGSQDFSLIATGIDEFDFAFTPDNISKTFCSDEVASYYFNYQSNTAYNGPTVLTATGLPAGAVATFTPASITADQDFTLNINGLENVTPGEYNFTVTATGPSGSRNKQLTLKVNSAAPLNNTSLTYPNNGESNVFVYPNLNWTTVPGATAYKVEVSQVSDFSSIYYETTTAETNVNVPDLASNTQYYWRVQPQTLCVEGNFTSANFTTETLSCSTNVSATDLPKSIDTVPTEVTSTINVTDDFLVGDVNVTLNINHTYVADMTISLISPLGTEVVLVSGSCGEYNNATVTFDDTAADFNCFAGTPALSGSMKPQNSLSAFIGENSVGNWTLKIVDPYDGDGGALLGFSLQMCSTAGPLSINEATVDGFAIYPNPAKNYFEFSLYNQQDDMSLAVYDINGRLLINKAFDLQTRKLVNVEGLSSGVYFVQITNGNQKGTKKLIVK
ncbi:MAG: S8 family serine peptidase [Gelidibacter sp.]